MLFADSALYNMDASAYAGFSSVPTYANLSTLQQQAHPKPSCDKCIWIIGGAIAIWFLTR